MDARFGRVMKGAGWTSISRASKRDLRSSVRDFLDKECSLQVVRALVESGGAPTELWASMVGLDWPALSVPEEYGGVGLGFVELAVVAEELGRSVDPGPLLSTISQFAPMVREAGTPEQRARFLSDVASGSMYGRSGAGRSPAAGPSMTSRCAERAEGGWVLEGTKYGVMTGHGVDEVAVVARAGDGVGAFVVPSADAGLQVVNSLDASRPTSTVTLERVIVSDDRALGEPGSAETTRAVARAIEEATTALALETVGACDALFQMVLAYVKDRKQFGVPVGSFQAMKHKMSNMFLAIERARSLCYFAVAAIDEDTPDRSTAVAMAKSASDDCQHLVCRESLQSFGGIGFTWEHDGHFFMKRATADGALFGGAPEHLLTVAASLSS